MGTKRRRARLSREFFQQQGRRGGKLGGRAGGTKRFSLEGGDALTEDWSFAEPSDRASLGNCEPPKSNATMTSTINQCQRLKPPMCVRLFEGETTG